MKVKEVRKDLEAQTLNNIDKLLDIIQRCERCNLYQNGRAMPFFSPQYYKDVLFLFEAPGKNEVEQNSPVVGKAGAKLWNIAQDYNMYRENFAIINSVNCRPVKVNEETKNVSNGKPTTQELDACKPFVEVFIKLLNPKLIVAFGSYAVETLLCSKIPVKKFAGEIKKVEIFNKYYEMLINVHPASLIYDKENEMKFKETMKKLGSMMNEY